MQKIGGLLMQTYQERMTKAILDDQTVFFIFRKIILREYGARGEQYISPRHYKNKKLFVLAKNSLWMSEVQMARESLALELNRELGLEAVTDIKVESSFT